MEKIEKLLDFMNSDKYGGIIINGFCIEKDEILMYLEKNYDLNIMINVRRFSGEKYIFGWYSIDDLSREYDSLVLSIENNGPGIEYYGIADKEYYINEVLDSIRQNKTTKSSKKTDGFVYFIKDINGYIKIGQTKNLKERLKKYVTENSQELEVIKSIQYGDCIKAEIDWHDRYKEKRIRGEWFELSEEDLEFIKSQ